MKKYHFLENIEEIEIKLNEDLSPFTSMHLKAIGDLIIVRSEVALRETVSKLTEHNLGHRLLGLGANQILPPISTVPLIKLNFPYDKSQFSEVREEYILEASIPLGVLTSHALKFGLKGWEVFTGIPATIGGAVFMNAGTELGEIGSLVKRIEVMTKEGKKKIFEQKDQELFSYRRNYFCEDGDIITKVYLVHKGIDQEIPKLIREYLNKRSRTQPLDKYTCGCVFKNYSKDWRAGKFIDILGLKGFTYKGLRISPLHANFIENSGDATSEDFFKMVEIIVDQLYLHFGVKFELEVQI